MAAGGATDGTIYQYTAKDIDGNDVSLDKYKGKVVMVVNVASKCGYTDGHYTQLKEVLNKYKDKGFEIAAFPCNQFANEEPGCGVDIKNFLKKYDFEPDLYDKINVNGNDAHPLYKFLKKEQGGTLIDAIKWNFTKFLVDRNGKPVGRWAPTTDPKSLEKDIEKLL
ncbi:glutathione peroxidase [Aphelenchoides avenae]|nr:glutathione peroxidase [Aphelenchus avenae]